MKKLSPKITIILGSVCLLFAAASWFIFRVTDKSMVSEYADENGIFKCSRQIKVEEYQAYGNGYKLSTFQRPFQPGESVKYCKQEASF